MNETSVPRNSLNRILEHNQFELQIHMNEYSPAVWACWHKMTFQVISGLITLYYNKTLQFNWNMCAKCYRMLAIHTRFRVSYLYPNVERTFKECGNFISSRIEKSVVILRFLVLRLFPPNIPNLG